MNKAFPGFSRRTVLKGAGALPLAAVLASPALAAAAAATMEDVTIETAGGRKVSASLAMPASTPAPAVLLIHEWWGLNDQIKSVAAELAQQGYLALAVDLYGRPGTADPHEARALVGTVKPDEATDTLDSWVAWLRGRADCTGKVASIGWCFGGGWSLEAAIDAGVDAAVIYYGRVDKDVDRLRRIEGPVLGHFATKDGYINAPMVEAFQANMAAAGKDLTAYWYEADHGFSNPTTARYDQEDAALAWQRTLAFLKKAIG